MTDRTNAARNRAIVKAIVRILDGETWTPDTLDRIANVLRVEGYDIRSPEDICGETTEGTGDLPYRCTLDPDHEGDHIDKSHPMHPSWRRA